MAVAGPWTAAAGGLSQGTSRGVAAPGGLPLLTQGQLPPAGPVRLSEGVPELTERLGTVVTSGGGQHQDLAHSDAWRGLQD